MIEIEEREEKEKVVKKDGKTEAINKKGSKNQENKTKMYNM